MKILLADDDPITLTMVSSILRKWGFTVVVVADGAAAWQQLQAPEPPLLCILDWRMPELSGVELIEKLRAEQRETYTYCMLLTSRDSREDLLEGMRAGADDYLVKPFDPSELQARINVAQRILTQQRQLDQARRREMDLASNIQQNLLFDTPTRTLPWADVAVLARPADHVAGDFYGFVEYGTQALDIFVGDVMGKGVPAALLGAAVKNRLLTSVLCTMARQKSCTRPEPADICAQVHHEMTDELIELESLVTLQYARIDCTETNCTFVDAGHMPIIHITPNSNSFSFLKGDNVPLGVLHNEEYRQHSFTLATNDVLVFYSDGLVDSVDRQGETLDAKRLGELVLEYADQPASAIVKIIEMALDEHDLSLSELAADDQTCIIIRLNGANQIKE